MMRFFLSGIFCLLLLLSPLWEQNAWARIYIDIDSPSGEALPLAISAAQSLDGEKVAFINQFHSILERDLKLTGLFRFVGRDSFLESKTAGITTDQTNFSLWRKSGADALVKAGYRKVGGTYTLEARLFDVQQQSVIVGKRYHFTEDKFRQIVHAFADQILLKLTGESGVFSKTRIAAVGKIGKYKEIFEMDVDGGNLKQLTHHRSIVLSPAWSSNGRYIAYTSYAKGNPDLYLYDRKKKKEKRISYRSGLNLGASFSPKKSEIAVAVSNNSDSEVVIMNYKGKILNTLTKNWWIDIGPSYSPEGNRLAFVSNQSGQPHVYRFDMATQEAKRLTYKGYHNVSPEWSPRNNKIAFAGRDKGYFDIFIMNTDGSQIQRLTINAGNNEAPSWSPNGQMLVFHSSRRKKEQLFVMGADGRGQVQISDGIGKYTQPAWSPWLHE